ncbi:unnamed protein product [Pieris brassicae]|uniref:Major facilitator superfamily (MFS) profile domain-containing protein n=1 Tax=Pieris brassicae TaxID=7116 RepID=A0A9P0SX84_PIEBR|nr:unnamed protein product [Pieris brassicae]
MFFKFNGSGHTLWQWLFGIIASLGFLLYGLEAAWLSPTTKYLQSTESPLGYPLSKNAISWIGSINCFASAFFVIPFSYSADKFGRKWIVIATVTPSIISILLRLFVPNLIVLLVARALVGIAGAGIFVVIPIYVRELCQTNLIGTIGSLGALLQNIGIVLMYLLGAYFDYYTMLWICLAFNVLMATMMIFAPESPAYLVKRGHIDKAYSTVAFLRGLNENNAVVKNEIEHIQLKEEEYKNIPKLGYREIFKNKSWRNGFIIMMLVWTTYGWNGALTIITYASAVLESTGSNINISPEIQSISFPVVSIIAAFTLTIVAERCGRKALHAGSYALSGFSFSLLGGAMLCQKLGYMIPDWLPITCMIIAVGMFSSGVRSLPFIICLEMFNFQVRAQITGIIQTYGWGLASTQLLAFPTLIETFGLHISFIIFGAINFIGMVIALFIPETRGIPEAEILRKLNK